MSGDLTGLCLYISTLVLLLLYYDLNSGVVPELDELTRNSLPYLHWSEKVQRIPTLHSGAIVSFAQPLLTLKL